MSILLVMEPLHFFLLYSYWDFEDLGHSNFC